MIISTFSTGSVTSSTFPLMIVIFEVKLLSLIISTAFLKENQFKIRKIQMCKFTFLAIDAFSIP